MRIDYKLLNDIEQQLTEIQDIDILLERILTETRRLVNADAGSIYVVENGNTLKIKHGQNDTRSKLLAPGQKLPYTAFSFPITQSQICGYVALTGKPLNIKNCYKIPESEPYKFNKSTDIITGYHTKSMYTFPLKNSSGKLLGVLQIINAKSKGGNIISFSEKAEFLITEFANRVASVLQDANANNNNIMRLIRTAGFHDPKETGTHVKRVSTYSLEIYDRWAYNHRIPEIEPEWYKKYRDNLMVASKLHDLGKVGISDVILTQNARFTDEQRQIMNSHTLIGAKIFEPVDNELDEMCQEIALHHHEWWDGSEAGYPGKVNLDDFSVEDMVVPSGEPMKGNEIPLSARIVAVADVFDALSHKRYYKDAWTIDEAFDEIQRGSGTHFDPEIVEAFLQIKERILAINESIPE